MLLLEVKYGALAVLYSHTTFGPVFVEYLNIYMTVVGMNTHLICWDDAAVKNTTCHVQLPSKEGVRLESNLQGKPCKDFHVFICFVRAFISLPHSFPTIQVNLVHVERTANLL